MTKLTHFNNQGRAKMVDVSNKEETIRTAIATSSVQVSHIIYEEILKGTNKKGDVFAVAQVAGSSVIRMRTLRIKDRSAGL
ncbi:MAG: cyclic pyranopterin monophosphate synthase MoaC, partial [Lysinibacillus sp.]